MGQANPVIEQLDFSGGLNAAEPPDQIGTAQVADLRNLEYRRGRSLKRRRGSTLNLTNATGVFAAGSSVVSLFRHTPGQSETSMELWGISNDTTPEVGRVAAGSAWAAVSLGDAIASAAEAWNFKGVSFNGKLFLPYNSSANRMHVWDGTSVRRMGLATPAAATVADTGAGAYAAVLRYYRVQWVFTDGVGNTVFSPLSDAVSFTPSGAGTAARVTRPSLAGESETSWLVWGSADGVNYYRLGASIAVATSTYDDSAAPSTYADAVPAQAGFPTDSDYFTVAQSAKFLLVDGAQLLLAGSHTNSALSSTVYYTPALNTTGFSVADDERVPSTNRIEVDPQQGGGITGLGGPIGGCPVVFKFDRTYLLVPTNDVTLPYTHQLLSDVVGCVSHQSIVMGEDERGAPALYWASRRGMYRYGAAGLEYLGADLEDLWSSVNLSATYGICAAYHRAAGQVWVFLPTGSDSTPSVLVKFHVVRARRGEEGVRGGWTRDDGNLATSSAVAMFATTPGATMSLDLKPYTAKVGSGGLVYKSDHTTNRDDNDDAAYTAYVITRAMRPYGLGQEFGVQTVYVQGVADSSVTLNVALRKDFEGSDSVTAIAASLGTTRGAVVVPGLQISECDTLQVRVADQSALNQHWTLDAIGVRTRVEAAKES